MPHDERAFDFLHLTARPAKPRDRGTTEIRGQSNDPMGPRALRDILESCHEFDVQVSTGGFVECICSGLWGQKSRVGKVASSGRE